MVSMVCSYRVLIDQEDCVYVVDVPHGHMILAEGKAFSVFEHQVRCSLGQVLGNARSCVLAGRLGTTMDTVQLVVNA